MFVENLNEIITLSSAVLLDGMVALIVIRRLHVSQLLISINTYALLLFNLLILFLCFTLSQLELSFGAGLGLFALLAILRFRSQVMKIDELIGLLLLLGVGFMHAIFPSLLDWMTIVLIDVILVVITFRLSSANVLTESVKIKVQGLAIINAKKRPELIHVLQEKMGLPVQKIEIVSMNLAEETTCLQVTFFCQKNLAKKKVKAVSVLNMNGLTRSQTLAQSRIS